MLMMSSRKKVLRDMEGIELTLPQELVIEILSWLPARSLCGRFKYACKAWCNLVLNDPAFAKLHLDRANATGTESFVWLFKDITATPLHEIRSKKPYLYQLKPPSQFETQILQTQLFDGSPLPSDSMLVGSCNGLICFAYYGFEKFVLMNPSTRRLKFLPKQEFVGESIPIGYGFGYDSTNDDYKVVRLDRHPDSHEDGIHEMKVYSTRTNSWRGVNDIRYTSMPLHRPGLFLNGAIHWVYCKRIFSFDVMDEEFREILLPSGYDTRGMYRMFLTTMRECLGFIHISRWYGDVDYAVEVWTMKEYGRRESWTKQFAFKVVPETQYSFRYIAMIGNQILFKTGCFIQPDVHLYDMKKEKMHALKLKGTEFHMGHVISYIETLVSLKTDDETAA